MWRIEMHVVPTSASGKEAQGIGGAYVNAYMVRDSLAAAKRDAIAQVLAAGWCITNEEPIEATPIPDPTSFSKYAEQAITDLEVLVFHQYPEDEADPSRN